MRSHWNRWTCCQLAFAFLTASLLLPNLSAAGFLSPGDIIVSNLNTDGIFLVNPVTGERTVISQTGVRGSGVSTPAPFSIVLDANNVIYGVSDSFSGSQFIFKVDPETGDRTIVSGDSQSGPDFVDPRGLAFDHDGFLLVTDRGLDVVMRVDPVTGARTIISDNNDVGPDWTNSTSLVVDHAGTIFTNDEFTDSIISVNPVTGARTKVTGDGAGSGTFFIDLISLAIDPSDTDHVYFLDRNRIVSVNKSTGFRTVIPNGGGVGFGSLAGETGLTFDNNGDFLVVSSIDNSGTSGVSNSVLRGVIRVDRITGARTVVSSSRENGPDDPMAPTGSGPKFDGVWDIAVVPNAVVPEPSSLALLLMGGLGLACMARRTGKRNP